MQSSNDNLSSDLMREILKQKRADRRWKNIRFIAWFGLLFFLVVWFYSYMTSPRGGELTTTKHVALIRLDGMIAPGRDFSAEELIPFLSDILASKNVIGAVLDINSGGGTPVQAAIIHDGILTLKKKYHKKIVMVGEDLLTSGAYYVAVAGDKIYVNANTITGSIGVIMKGFGFVDLLKKVGVERRVYTAGTAKDRLDPFLPQTPEDVDKIRQVMAEVHQNFTQAVLEGRKGKLNGDPQILFSGDFWSGQTALKLGLVDGLGNWMDVMDKEFHTADYHEYSISPGFLKMLTGQVSTEFDKLFYT